MFGKELPDGNDRYAKWRVRSAYQREGSQSDWSRGPGRVRGEHMAANATGEVVRSRFFKATFLSGLGSHWRVQQGITVSDSYFTNVGHPGCCVKKRQMWKLGENSTYKGELFLAVVGYYQELFGNIWELG